MTHTKHKIPRAKGELAYEIFSSILCVLIVIVSVYPIYYILICSLSNPFAVQSGEVLFSIKGFTLESFKAAFNMDGLWRAYGNTIFYTVFGVIFNMFFTTTMAYALSKKRLVARKFFTLLVAFTLWFQAGMIPLYLTLRNYHMLDKRITILLAFAVNAYNLIIMRSFFEQLPESLEEAAFIDGASNMRIFWSIYLPLSKPALVTVGTFYAVNRWNNYFWAMNILTDDKKIPLQVMLKKLLVDRVAGAEEAAIITAASATSPDTIIYAVIILAVIPMLIAYPYVQRYFKSGATLGAVKG